MPTDTARVWQGDIERGACLSRCERYRYTLWRRWSSWPLPDKSPCMVFVMLNPSTADGKQDDPTIRRCMGFANSHGFSAMLVVNLFAFRATNPRDLWAEEDPIGPENDEAIWLACSPARNRIVAAWGSPKHALHEIRSRAVSRMLQGRMSALAVTKHGHPRHPLYLPATSTTAPWPAEAAAKEPTDAD